MALIKCPECGNSVSDMTERCVHCGFPIHLKKSRTITKKKCSYCGGYSAIYEEECPSCGARFEEITTEENIDRDTINVTMQVESQDENTSEGEIAQTPVDEPKQKNKWVSFWLCFFLGAFGAHKFYEGRIIMGIVYLATGAFSGLGWTCDTITFLLKPEKMYDPQNPSKEEKKGKWIAVVLTIVIFMIPVLVESANDANGGGTEMSSDRENSVVDEVVYLLDAEIDNAYASPDRYAGKYITIGGKVFGEPENHEDELYFQMYGDPINNGKNTIVHLIGTADVADGDYVKVDGKIVGSSEYKNMLGGTLTAVLIETENVTKSTYIECCSPTIKEVVLDKSIEQHGYAVTVNKIEFSEKETRLYLTVTNNGEDNFSVYPFNIKIVQNQKQYECVNNYDADYEELQTDLLPDTSTSGIVVFPPIDSKTGLMIYCEGSCDDWYSNLEQYVFEY